MSERPWGRSHGLRVKVLESALCLKRSDRHKLRRAVMWIRHLRRWRVKAIGHRHFRALRAFGHPQKLSKEESTHWTHPSFADKLSQPLHLNQTKLTGWRSLEQLRLEALTDVRNLQPPSCWVPSSQLWNDRSYSKVTTATGTRVYHVLSKLHHHYISLSHIITIKTWSPPVVSPPVPRASPPNGLPPLWPERGEKM